MHPEIDFWGAFLYRISDQTKLIGKIVFFIPFAPPYAETLPAAAFCEYQ